MERLGFPLFWWRAISPEDFSCGTSGDTLVTFTRRYYPYDYFHDPFKFISETTIIYASLWTRFLHILSFLCSAGA